MIILEFCVSRPSSKELFKNISSLPIRVLLQINNDCCGKSELLTFVLLFLEMFSIHTS